MRLISLDPGTQGFGVACWRDGLLVLGVLEKAFYGKGGPKDWCDHIPWSIIDAERTFSALVVEIPQVYPQSRWKGDANDLINVGFRAGEAVGYLKRVFKIDEVVTYRPFEWKKNTPKEISNERTLAALSSEEQLRIQWPSAVKTLGHNVVDSIGIGLFYLRSKGMRNDA